MDEEEKMDLMKLTVRALAWSRPLSRGWSSHCSPLDNVSFNLHRWIDITNIKVLFHHRNFPTRV